MGKSTLLRRAAAMEAGGWRNLYGWATRRPRVPAGAEAFRYDAPLLPIIGVFIGVSAVELVAVDLIVHQWPVPRVVALVVGVWGLTFMAGYLASLKMTPHAVGPDGVRVRHSTMVDAHLPWEAIETVAARKHVPGGSGTVQLVQTEAGAVVHLVVQGETTVEVTLRRPRVVELPNGPAEVVAVRFYADDSRALVRRARELLAVRADA